MIGIYLIAFMQLLISCNQKAEPETYLIPSDFNGEVNILFNQNGIPVKYKNEYGRDTIYTPKLGNPIKYENGRRIYEIPANGILLTQFKDTYGFIDKKYFSVNNNGERMPMKVFDYEYNKDGTIKWVVNNKNEKGIFGDGTTGSYGNINIAFEDFIVCSYCELDSFYTNEYRINFDGNIEKITGLTLNFK